ncbi:MAG: ParB/RepB/Spo0J family partition protein [Nostoc sp.]|uniref:ParB/RepB/Spo0J family partition protein n=1 Tax=Nostoc sp. TaxID=1180 RepID=UPI002FF816D4
MLTETFNQVVSKPGIDAKYSSFSYQLPNTVPIEKIRLPLKQPRRYFDSNKLTQLIQSIKQHGILEPVLVRPLDNGEYELVSGERRIRAASVVGLVEVPIVLRELDDKQALQVALMENLQREDLNPVEETEAVLDILAISLEIETNEVVSLLHRSFNAKQRGQQLNQNDLIKLEQIELILSEIGKFNAASFRSSRLPLLNLPSDILSALRQGEIEYTKAQAIARVKSEQLRSELLKIAIAENLSLSEIKTRVKNFQSELQTNPKKIVTERLSILTKLLHKKSSLIHAENSERITQLLDELEKVIIES